jgi:high-affinity iron transporter
VLPTFVIGLREGLEAALIVGIVAAFLKAQKRTDALRWMWVGVGAAVTICAAGGIALELASRSLPQKEQEGLETVIAAVAVVAVTWMVLWMRRHAHDLKRTLTSSAGVALASGSAIALVGMAFFAVIREGFETAVFLIAAFDASTDPVVAGMGAVLGVVVACAIGYGIYRGGVRINLSRFFRATGVVLVLVAAGLVASALHTAHEAGWLNGLQDQALDLRWLVEPGSVRSALLTGMLGVQPRPTVGELAGYLIYAIPMLLVVLWPRTWRLRPRHAAAGTAGAAAAVVTVLLVAGCGGGSDSSSSAGPSTSGDGRTVNVTLTDSGCPASLDLQSGPTTFEVTNDGADAVSEFEILDGDRILGEVENLAPGLSGKFSLTLKNGTYTTYCPGGDATERGQLTVAGTGGGSASKQAAAAVDRYRAYVDAQTALLVTRTKAFANAVKAGDVEQAKELYVPARVPYERIEPIAESFGGLDPAIDARAGDVPAKSWGGFHVIERQLWVRGNTAGMAPVADKLVADVESLQRKAKGVELEPAQIANGSVELLGEVSKSKITGEEERYSHTDLDDFKANVEGARAGYDAVRPLVAAKRAALATRIDARFAAVDKALVPYRDGNQFASYTTLDKPDTRALSRAIDSLAEPLSNVGGIVVAQK